MYNLAFAVVLLPWLGALSSFLAETSRRVAQTCTFFTFLSGAVATFLLGWHLRHSGDGPFDNVYTFWDFRPNGGATPVFQDAQHLTHFQPQFGVHVDPLSLTLMVAVSVAAFVVQWHSLTAVRGDADYRRLFWLSSVLVGAVLGAVVSASLFQLLLMWGLSGTVAWMLVTHWWQQADIASSARRSFVVNRIADASLLFGCILVFVKLGASAEGQPVVANTPQLDPFAFSTLSGQVDLALKGSVPGVGSRTLLILGVLFVVAAAVRLAQIPFSFSMLDAEHAPLPALVLSALLPAVCGVVLLTRLYPLLIVVPHLLSVVAVVGAATAVLGAVMAVTQRDMARTVLCVVISQLGMIVATVGTGGYSNALQMLIVFMAFTTGLMLSCSNLVRGYRTRDIAEMGGAIRRMPTTSLLLGLSCLAIAGLNLNTYAAVAAAMRNTFPNAGHVAIPVQTAVVILLAVAILTLSMALARLWKLVSTGSPAIRRGFQADRISEVPGTLWRSAAFAVIGGVVAVGLGIPALAVTYSHYVFFGPVHQDLSVISGAAALAGTAAVVGIVAGVLAFRRRGEASAPTARPALTRFIESGGQMQWLAPAVAAWSAGRIGDLVVRTDEELTDRFTIGFGEGFGLLEAAAEHGRTRRLPLYVAVAVAFAVAIVLGAGLYASGHFPGLTI